MRQLLPTIPKLSLLLVCLPIAIALELMHVEGLPLFVVSALGILGTVTLIGKATEEVAIYSGPLWGGLLNATFGNVTELIIALFALSKGPALYPIVLGSIIGSMLGNLLLVLGAAMVWGGMRHQVQRISRTGASINVGMLWVVLSVLMVPSLVELAYRLDPSAFPDLDEAAAHLLVREVSLAAAVILLGLYVLSLLFSMRTHRFLLMPHTERHETPQWSKRFSAGVLLVATLIVAFLSETFVSSIEVMRASGTLAVSDMFIGVVLVAVVGNAAEGMVAIWVARDDKMDLSFQIAMGSCMQVALLVAPVLVIASWFMGALMPLAFDPFMLLSLAAATMIASSSLSDGETNWLEGAMFLAVYAFFAVVFWYHP